MTIEFRRLIGAMECCGKHLREGKPDAKGHVFLHFIYLHCPNCKDNGYCNLLLEATEEALNRRLEVAEILSKRG